MRWLMFILLGLVMIAPVSAIDYSASTTTECNEVVCKFTQYSKTEFVWEDGTWKHWTKARSLKGKGFIEEYIEVDSDYEIEVTDFNATSIEVNLNSAGLSIFPNPVPVRTWKDDKLPRTEENRTGDFKKDFRKTREQNINFHLFNQKEKVKYEFSIGDILEFGPNSTTITLSAADSENLADSGMRENAPSTAHGAQADTDIHFYSGTTERTGIIEFNITSIPDAQNILSANISFNIGGNNLDTGEGLNVSIHRVYNNFSWTEAGITWNTRPLVGSNFTAAYDDKLFIDDSSSGWVTFNVTDAVNATYLENENSAVLYYGPIDEEVTGSPGSSDAFKFDMKEHPGSATDPVMIIVYEAGAAISDSYGCTYSTGDWYPGCHNNCVISSSVSLNGNRIILNDTGTLTINNNVKVFNWSYMRSDATCYYKGLGSGGFY